jgi:hypothetical protein
MPLVTTAVFFTAAMRDVRLQDLLDLSVSEVRNEFFIRFFCDFHDIFLVTLRWHTPA